MELEDAILAARGWSFHHEIVRRALDQYRAGHYDDAVLAAFKAVEEHLRSIINVSDGTGQKLVDTSFHPVTGLLIDPLALPAALEGQYLFFKGAFLRYRNPQAHNFVGLTQAEAFDLVVLANRMLITIEHAQQLRRAQQIQGATLPQIDLRRNSYLEPGPYLLDCDNDGESEIIVPEGSDGAPFKVFDVVGNRTRRAEVEPLGYEGFVEDIIVGDVDNDGLQELVCVLGWTANTGLVFYKFRNGRYEVLRKDHRQSDMTENIFPDAHLADYDEDRNQEVISVPWEAVPEDLIPPDHDRSWTWGRVRYVWRWNRSRDQFDLLQRELVRFGGR